MWETDKFQAGLKFVIKGGVSAFWNGQPDAYIGHVSLWLWYKSNATITKTGYRARIPIQPLDHKFNHLTLALAATAVAKWSHLCPLRYDGFNFKEVNFLNLP